ncbi:MAG TPA: hypothetical protein VNU71_10875 [Burkholderiaceae bacterium]|nr:hypothetical protein [Burkholderiaceae bacterium]
MNRAQLEHVLRAAAAIASENSLVVVGSQAVLLPFPDAPAALLTSREVDLYPAIHPERADLIDGAIGALSSFDETFGYHADGVGPETAVMPADWMSRASFHYIDDVTAICPDIHDLGVLLKERMIDIETLCERIGALDPSQQAVESVLAWARRRAGEAAA